MAAHVIIGAVALAGVSICGMIATFANFEMMDKVNEKLSKGNLFSATGWSLCKRQELHREYRTLYPSGRLLLGVRVLTALMIVCFLISAWGFGFFSR